MKTAAVFYFLLGLAFARGDTSSDKVNHLETKNSQQVVKPPTLETASTRTGDLQIAHMQYQANRMDNQELNYQQHSQLPNPQAHAQNEVPQFYNQNQAPPHVLNQGLGQQFRTQSQTPFDNQDEAQIQQFHRQSQTASGSPAHQGQEISRFLQSQQRMSPAPIDSFRAQTNDPNRDFSAQQLYSDSIRPQQRFYQDRRDMVDVQGHPVEKGFDESSDKQTPVIAGFHSSEIRAGGFPQIYQQKSAFDSREQPIVLPGVRQTHSTSVVVSGLKNLPVLPTLVYSAGTVPSAHAITYGRPWLQGGAYLNQHFQTPYARYVYSHML